jgi:hypothetical protein
MLGNITVLDGLLVGRGLRFIHRLGIVGKFGDGHAIMRRAVL